MDDRSSSNLQESLLCILECPVCTEIMRSPILQCLGGHSFCSNCMKQITQCPVCKTSVSKSVRNFSLEKLSELTNPCPNQKHGCQESVVGVEDPHEIRCPFRKDICPKMQDIDTKCSLKGPNKRTLEQDSQDDLQAPKRCARWPDQRPGVSCPHGDNASSALQCSSGKRSCFNCIEQVTQRPVYRASVTNPQMNYSMKFPHGSGCPLREYQCPMSQDMDTECSWKGRSIHILTHAREVHPQKIFNVEEGTQYFKYAYKEEYEHHVYLMHLKDDLFVSYDHYEKWQEKCWMAVQYLGACEQASKFVYNITIASQNHSREMKFSRQVHTEHEDVQTLFETNDCFTMTEQQMLMFKPSNETYKFYSGWNIIRV